MNVCELRSFISLGNSQRKARLDSLVFKGENRIRELLKLLQVLSLPLKSLAFLIIYISELKVQSAILLSDHAKGLVELLRLTWFHSEELLNENLLVMT